jgi:hypothetical protein
MCGSVTFRVGVVPQIGRRCNERLKAKTVGSTRLAGAGSRSEKSLAYFFAVPGDPKTPL